jgi:phosphotransferase system  glucose/maltose/N-acetylglucosamine-specific IIC component
VVFAVVYFLVFYFVIGWLDIPTPGREPTTIDEEAAAVSEA